MYCWNVEYLHFFTPIEIPNACLILEQHVRVLFEGNVLLNAWLQDLHRVSSSELTFFLSSAGDLWVPASVTHAQVLVFCSEKQKRLLASFPFLSSVCLSLSAVFCEQTITYWHNNKSLLGNGTTLWEFCFQSWSIWCIWNSGPFTVKCQCQEILHQVNYSQIKRSYVESFISACGLFFTACCSLCVHSAVMKCPNSMTCTESSSHTE